MRISNDECGVLYLAFGYNYLTQAINSYRTLRNKHPELPASIITNLDLPKENPGGIFDELGYFDSVINVRDSDNNNRHYKTQLIQYSPYDRTLFIDTDTRITGNITPGFHYLNKNDLAIRPFSYPLAPSYFKNGRVNIQNVKDEDTVIWNSGVMFFSSNSDVEYFFDRWNELFLQFGYSRDQYSLANAIYNTKARVYPLHLTWNASLNVMQGLSPQVRNQLRIHHYKGNGRRDHSIIKELKRVEHKIPHEGLQIDDAQRAEFYEMYSMKSYVWENMRKRLNKYSTLSRIYRWIQNARMFYY